MDELIARALDLAAVQGASYADVRLVNSDRETYVVRNGVVDTLSASQSTGFGVRVVAEGGWGFAASHDLSPSEVDRVTALAVRIARSSALQPPTSADGKRDGVRLRPPVTSKGVYSTPLKIDPFTVSPDEKLELLLAADKEMALASGASPRAVPTWSSSGSKRPSLIPKASHVEQTVYESGAGIQTTAVGNGEVQRRSYPDSHGLLLGRAGWEYVLAMDLAGNAQRTAEEAVALLTADQCPSGETTAIIGGCQLALQVHESCGHAVELDRALGSEAAFAGTSFLTPDKLNDYRYGSEHVNITADSLRLPGLGAYGWDDEGVPAQSTPIIENGLFVGYLMSRESASVLGLESNGCMRASSWDRIPLVRMTNVSLEPGAWSLDDLVADTDAGIYMETNRSWSIDDRRYNFQFGTEIGYEIKGGKLGRLLKNCTYTGITPQFWNSCDAVCNQDHWVMWGTPQCGKGQPGQVAHTGHGAAPARFRNLQVGVMR